MQTNSRIHTITLTTDQVSGARALLSALLDSGIILSYSYRADTMQLVLEVPDTRTTDQQ